MRILTLLVLLALAACANGPPLYMPEGDWRPLNPDRWKATVNDLKTPPPMTYMGHI